MKFYYYYFDTKKKKLDQNSCCDDEIQWTVEQSAVCQSNTFHKKNIDKSLTNWLLSRFASVKVATSPKNYIDWNVFLVKKIHKESLFT